MITGFDIESTSRLGIEGATSLPSDLSSPTANVAGSATPTDRNDGLLASDETTKSRSSLLGPGRDPCFGMVHS
jgi:hypothetical protein